MIRRPRQPLAALLALVSSLLLAPAAHAEDATTGARVIVKFRDGSSLLRKQVQSATDRRSAQATALGDRVGRPLQAGFGVGERAQVVTASGIGSAALAQRLAQEADVEYAVPDERKRALDVPNDPLYNVGGASGPAVGQWYLRAPDTTTVAAINAPAAWSITTGSPGIVVADLDTGIRFDHVDFTTTANGGNILPGYDMVTDVNAANDGDGRDADASDPGDWITAAENASGTFRGCKAQNSSWHGTQTAGLIAATTNNSVGMASLGRGVRLLPVRVLGKCGGMDSDIIAGMRWAAGLAVDGVPTNPNPARVINMSLGGTGTCNQAYVDVFNQLTAAGVTVVISAGNSEGLAVQTPANCPGAVAVAGIRHAGDKVGFSDIGPEITISAPAGNCVASSGACQYPILTTINTGTTTPVAGAAGASYSDAFAYSAGTSFSAPLVTGTIGLMLSAQPSLTPAAIVAKLRSTARAFPTSGGTSGSVPQCVAPSSAVQDECYCTTSTCGAGMLDAGAAVLSAASIVAQASFSPSSPTVGQAVTFTSTTQIASGRTIASYAWTLTAGSGIAAISGASNAATLTVNTTGAGSFTVQLVVTDNAGSTSTTSQTVGVQAATAAPVSSGGGGGAVGMGWLMALALAVLAVGLIRRRGPVAG